MDEAARAENAQEIVAGLKAGSHRRTSFGEL
jgi:hypothetical protein